MSLRWTSTLVIVAGTALLIPTVTSGPGSSSADCGGVEAFADDLTDVGYVYDYEPSTSPAELASWVDVAVLGTLTGDAEIGEQRGEAAEVYLGYEIAVDEVIVGRLPPPGDQATVSMGYAPSRPGLDDTAAAVPAGIPVVVFAYEVSVAPGGLVATAMEGFVLGCPGTGLRGWVGDQGAWSSTRSVEAVGDAARAHG